MKSYILLTISLVAAQVVIGQKYPWVSYTRGVDDIPEMIHFYDTVSGEEINRFDVRAHQPFQDLPYPVTSTGPYGKIYDLSGVPKEEIVERLLPGVRDICLNQTPPELRFTRNYPTFRAGNDVYHVILIYQFDVIGGERGLSGIHTMTYILDRVGHILDTLPLPNGGNSMIALTPDGHYAGFKTTDGDPEGWGCNLPMQTHIYDLSEHKIVYTVGGQQSPIVLGNEIGLTWYERGFDYGTDYYQRLNLVKKTARTITLDIYRYEVLSRNEAGVIVKSVRDQTITLLSFERDGVETQIVTH
ncbi:MAG: hypothetical protein SF053_15330 [Bacteroidia bacterium]|nr:hypothetical protein [Bacteroidia bacterium]